MIRFILKVAYFACEATDNNKSSKNGILKKVVFNGLKVLCMFIIELILRVKYLLLKDAVKKLDDSDGPILSLTSFPARINDLWIVMDSFFRQTVRPSKIILVLTNEEFPDGMSQIPKTLTRLLDKGLEIVFVDYNLRPHNKYYYTLSTYKDKDVVTLDDDLYYWPDTIERLYKLKTANPGCICANRVLEIKFNDGEVSYGHKYNSKGFALMAQGVGGVLYIPSFRTKEMFDKELIRNLSLPADDNWLRVHEILANIHVVTGDNYPHPLTLLKSQSFALWHENIGGGRSNLIMDGLIDYYHISRVFFK